MAAVQDPSLYLAGLGATRQIAESIHSLFLDQGCESYVKTIYVGYEIGGDMVGAMYAKASRIELAVALAEDQEGTSLIDASHLTWKTLPLALVVRTESDLADCAHFIGIACERIRSQTHDVERDSEYFARSKRERR